MYIKSINTYFIENPKCGSRTVDYVLKSVFSVEDMSLEGHLPFKDVIRKIPKDAKIYGVVRNPQDRLISALFMWCNTPKQIDDHLTRVLGGIKSNDRCLVHHVYGPQVRYVPNHSSRKMQIFTFENLTAFIRSLGWNKEIPHKNKYISVLSPEDAKNRPLFSEVLNLYKDDFSLYQNIRLAGGQ